MKPEELKLEALRLAVHQGELTGESAERILEMAAAYTEFLWRYQPAPMLSIDPHTVCTAWAIAV